jgi:UPF0716 protein FxsA
MVIRPLLRYVALYAAVELAAVALLILAVGLGWTLVVLAVTFLVGLVLAASQVKGQVGAIRKARQPKGAVTDGVLVGLGSLLVFVPGLVTTAAGALMLAPPTRAAMRPLASTLLGRGVVRGVSAMNLDSLANLGAFTNSATSHRVGRVDYIDGEVIGEPVHRTAPARTAIVRRAGLHKP